jgi:hypothetical protein
MKSDGGGIEIMGGPYRWRKLPYRTKTFSLDCVFARSLSDILTTVSNSSSEIQSPASTSSGSKKGRYFARISGSSSASEMARDLHCAKVLKPALWDTRREGELIRMVFVGTTRVCRSEERRVRGLMEGASGRVGSSN